jgi:lipopolysaccharide export system permease protein
VIRFQEIARFACSGTARLKIFLFALLQIPYILPIAIPISSLITGMLLFQKLSKTNELTAFRACGLGLKPITTPLIITGLFLSLINLTISSEIAPRCKALSKALIYQTAAANPLFLLQKESLVKLKNTYVDMKVLKSGKYAEDVVFAIKNSSNSRLTLMVAKELALRGELLKGEQVAFISSVDPKKRSGFDHLIIENQSVMNTKASNLSRYTQSNDWHETYDYQPMRMILTREAIEKERHNPLSMGRSAQFELSRRLSISLAAFTFTLIGMTFGIQLSRNRSKKGVIYAVSLACFYLICFLTAKSFKHSAVTSSLIFLLPHPLIIFLSLRTLKSINRGIE